MISSITSNGMVWRVALTRSFITLIWGLILGTCSLEDVGSTYMPSWPKSPFNGANYLSMSGCECEICVCGRCSWHFFQLWLSGWPSLIGYAQWWGTLYGQATLQKMEPGLQKTSVASVTCLLASKICGGTLTQSKTTARGYLCVVYPFRMGTMGP